MNKKILLSGALALALVITGCGKNTAKGNEVENIDDNNKGNKIVSCNDLFANGTTWSVELDKDDKLLYVTKESVYKSKEEDYKRDCESFTKIVNKENEAGYDFRTSAIECDGENFKTIITRKWDVSKNTEKIDIKRTISFIDENGKFDIDVWKQTVDKDTCVEK